MTTLCHRAWPMVASSRYDAPVRERIALLAVVSLCLGCGAKSRLETSNATNIVKVIQQAQKANVRASFGEDAYQCFTDLDYQAFVQGGQARKAAKRLLRDRTFMEAVLALREIPELDRERLRQSCRKPLRPSWTQLGRVTSEGQTEAGKHAELDIANAVTDEASRLSNLSPQEVEAAFRGR